MPQSQHFEKGRNTNFILCFYSKDDKKKFLKQCKKTNEINIDYYTYINFRVRGVWNTNMVKCKARKNFNIFHRLTDEYFSEEIPF